MSGYDDPMMMNRRQSPLHMGVYDTYTTPIDRDDYHSPNDDDAMPRIESIDALNNTLATLGLSCLDFPSIQFNGGNIDAFVARILFAGLNKVCREKNNASSQAKELSLDSDRLRSDLSHSIARGDLLREQLSDSDRRSRESEMKRRVVEKEFITKEKSLKADVAALEKKCVMIQRRDNQYKHEMRKVELNFDKLQEKMNKIIIEKSASVSTSGMGSVKSLSTTSTNIGGWDMTKGASSSSAAGRVSKPSMDFGSTMNTYRSAQPLPSSSPSSASVELELCQRTLDTYSDRMNELVGENIALKNSFKIFESELTQVWTEGQKELKRCERRMRRKAAPGYDAANDDAAADDDEDDVDTLDDDLVPDDNGAAIPSSHASFSPRTRALLADYHPSQIDLPWNLVGDTISQVLRAKIQMLREQFGRKATMKGNAKNADEERDSRDVLREKIEQQNVIIDEQDKLLQSCLFADDGVSTNSSIAGRSNAVTMMLDEERENRRLSCRAEAEDLRRRAKVIGGARSQSSSSSSSISALMMTPGASGSSLPSSSNPLYASTPMRAAGVRTTANLPVFATPVFARAPSSSLVMPTPMIDPSSVIQSSTQSSQSSSSSLIIPDGSPSSSPHSSPRPIAVGARSKWATGGLVTPIFTPSKRVNAGDNRRTSRIGESDDEEEDEEEEEAESY